MKNSTNSRKPNLAAFHLSCWILGLIAFAQLMSVGTAMAFRQQVAPEPEERIVREYIRVPVQRSAPVTVKPQPASAMAAIDAIPEEDLVPDLAPLQRIDEDELLDRPPVVLDPIVESLLQEASQARVQGDLILALTKLQEAQLREGDNANVLYSLGSTYEAFGQLEKASAFFLKVYQMGTDAGSLFDKVSYKLARGWLPDVKNLARLGFSRMTNPTRQPGGERRTLILPVEVDLNKDFDPMLFTPKVRFFEEIDGEVVQATISEGDSGSKWVTGVTDWKDGEEVAEVWYFVPDQDAATGLLFGERKFYGFVAELYYDGRLVDVVSYPRTLRTEGESTMEGLRRELDELDGLDLSDLIEGTSILPRMDLPSPSPSSSDSGE